MDDNQKEKINNMRQEGKSYTQIASILNINKNTVKAYCRRTNLETIQKIESKNENEISIVCKYCGKSLIQVKRGQPQKFCSEQCRRLWWKDNDKKIDKKAYYTLSCAQCGKKFESYGNKNRKFCSHTCYINNRFKKESGSV